MIRHPTAASEDSTVAGSHAAAGGRSVISVAVQRSQFAQNGRG